MKTLATALIATVLAATSAAAMQAKGEKSPGIVHSDPGEIRISPNNDSR